MIAYREDKSKEEFVFDCPNQKNKPRLRMHNGLIYPDNKKPLHSVSEKDKYKTNLRHNMENTNILSKRELSDIIGYVLSKNNVEKFKQRIKNLVTHDILYEDAFNSLYSYRGTESEKEHLRTLKDCLDGKNELSYDMLVKKRHDYNGVLSFFSDYLNGKTKIPPSKGEREKIRGLKQRLSPRDSLELVILDTLNFIENNGNRGAEVDVDNTPLNENKLCANYVRDLAEVLDGKRPYRLFTFYSKDGNKYSNVRILS